MPNGRKFDKQSSKCLRNILTTVGLLTFSLPLRIVQTYVPFWVTKAFTTNKLSFIRSITEVIGVPNFVIVPVIIWVFPYAEHSIDVTFSDVFMKAGGEEYNSKDRTFNWTVIWALPLKWMSNYKILTLFLTRNRQWLTKIILSKTPLTTTEL